VTEKDLDRVALIDMDGHLCDHHGAMERDLKKVLGDADVPPEVRENVKRLIASQIGWYRNLQPLPLGFAIVDMFRRIGFRLMVLTKGNKLSRNAWTEKVEWICQYMPDVDVTVTMDKGIAYGRVLADDYPHHFNRWLEHRPRGIVLVPDQPWNQDVQETDRIFRIRNEADLAKVRPILQAAYDR